MNLFSLDLGLGFGFGLGLGLGLGKQVRGKWGWGWRLKIYPWTEMKMKIIPVNGGGPRMDGVFLSGYGDGDYTPRPRSDPLPSLFIVAQNIDFQNETLFLNSLVILFTTILKCP